MLRVSILAKYGFAFRPEKDALREPYESSAGRSLAELNRHSAANPLNPVVLILLIWDIPHPVSVNLHSERTQGFAADPDYWKGEAFAYVGSIQNLKDLKGHSTRDITWHRL